MPKVLKETEMAVGIKPLFKAITDFESYPEFLSEVVSAKAKSDKGKTLVDFELEIMKRFQYTLEFKITGQEEVEWKLVESNFFKVNSGKWSLKSLDSEHTQVGYELEVDFGFLVPSWISKRLTENSLPKMFENFENRAKHISGK